MPESKTSLLSRGFQMTTPRAMYFLIFAVSGFSGLIYESIWSHYLKLFLGHAAYAQSLVLIIFMGGMALGSWFASRFSAKSKSPLLIYAAVEMIVGVVALLFHEMFTSIIETFYASVLPSVGSPGMGAVLKWLAASILIMPQSILLGMTFPLMSAGIIRRYPDTPGGSIAMLYFTNSIGAALGVLASGFWLIKLVGLPGTIFTAGLMNIALATLVFVLVRLDPNSSTTPIATEKEAGSGSSLKVIFLVAAFITGAASFIYEISWIRMLSLVLGATTHSFELMLSAFITGLAFGGLWIKRRIDRIKSPVLFSGYVQLIMGVLALLTIPVFVSSFYWMEWLLQALDKTDAGYASFSFASHAIALGVMLPTTFMAGMTLPLFTYVLIRQGEGEASIGQIYAANTIGAIVGVIFAVHIGLPMLGLKGLIILGALLDVVLGLVLLSRVAGQRRQPARLTAAAVIGIGALVLTFTLAQLDQKLLISGVYRHGRVEMPEDDKVVYYKDGKTSSVSLLATTGGVVVLSTNGKPDASIQFNPNKTFTTDEITMIIAGTLPMAYMPDAKRVANVGMGSGLTTHVLLAHESIEKLDTIEIEKAMVEAASGYGDFVSRAFEDPRSTIHIEDAKTFFSLHNSVYDMIIAEPSNPWVSGVASLFSTEFYSTIKNHLVDDGLFIQWIQMYEFDDTLAISIMKALSENFDDYTIYLTDGANILLIAKNNGDLPEPDWSALFETGMAPDLARLNVLSGTDMQVRKLIDRDSLVPYLKRSNTPTNSDYFPYVDLNAGKARYKESHAELVIDWTNPPLPLFEMLNNEQIDYDAITNVPFLSRVVQHENAKYIYRSIVEQATQGELGAGSKHMTPDIRYVTSLVRSEMGSCDAEHDWESFRFVLHDVMLNTLPDLPAEMAVELVDTIGNSSCATEEFVSPEWIDLYRAIAARDAAGMSAIARTILAQERESQGLFHEYLMSAAMLGDVVAGRSEDALAIWNDIGEEMFADHSPATHTAMIHSLALDSDSTVVAHTNGESR